VPLSRYHVRFPDPVRPGSHLLFSTRKGSLVRLSGPRTAALLAGEATDAERATLSRLSLWTDDPAAERAEMEGIVDATNLRSRSFLATVVLTLDCNLACPYCFEGSFRDGSAMDGETARRLVAFVEREQVARGRDVEIRFYGGEPLLALPRLEEIASALSEAAARAGTKFTTSLVTNGTLLTRPVVEELLPLGLASAQVTLDGPAEIHDRQRPFVSGGGSYRAVLSNLAAVHDLVTLRLGGNFTLGNHRAFPRMLDDLLDAGIDPSRLDPVQFSPILPKAGRSAGRDGGACLPLPDDPRLVEAALFLREETLSRGFPVDRPGMGICMVELENRLVVGRDGTLYKCPVFMGWPELAVGTVEGGVGEHASSHRLGLWKTEECLECPFLPMCFGGCRLLPLIRHGTVGADCRKGYFGAALERIVLQRLRYGR
jgi:uncharacterized protein